MSISWIKTLIMFFSIKWEDKILRFNFDNFLIEFYRDIDWNIQKLIGPIKIDYSLKQ